MTKKIVAILAAVVLAAAVAFMLVTRSNDHSEESAQAAQEAAGEPAAQQDGGSAAEELGAEQAEVTDVTDARVHAFEVAQRTGAADIGRISHVTTPGWDNSTIFGNKNDWEPDVAADPSSNYVYLVTTRYGSRACAKCPNGAIVDRVSSDNGNTWGPVDYPCACKGAAWQADPQVEVANDGTVYVLILQQWHTYLVTSTDHGQTWSDPKDVAPPASLPYKFTDHGFLTISPDGQDVYVAFNDRDSYVVASHDGGQTFGTPVRTNPPGEDFYYYHYKGATSADGQEVWIAATSVTKEPDYATGLVRYFVLHSTDGGETWEQIKIDTVEQQPSCKGPANPSCRADHFAGLSGLTIDPNGTLAYVYAGSRVPQNGELVFVTTSTDGGATWTDPKRVSPTLAGSRRVIAVFPQVISGGVNDFRLWYMDNRNGTKSWNIWARDSVDGGATWSPDARISNATGGAGYIHKSGFDADYGDYGGIAVMSNGKTIATWGEGYSYFGPGGTWINKQT